MSSYDKISKAVKIYKNMDSVKHVNEMAAYLKSNLRELAKGSFVDVDFKESQNNGILFVKFAKHSFKEATNDQLTKSPTNFIITVEGFEPDGSFDSNSSIQVETRLYYNENKSVRRLSKKTFLEPTAARDYIKKYFEKYKSYFITEEGEGGGGISGGGSAPSSDVSGGTSSTNFAAFKKRLPGLDTKRKKDEHQN